jgi:hypothetical protein
VFESKLRQEDHSLRLPRLTAFVVEIRLLRKPYSFGVRRAVRLGVPTRLALTLQDLPHRRGAVLQNTFFLLVGTQLTTSKPIFPLPFQLKVLARHLLQSLGVDALRLRHFHNTSLTAQTGLHTIGLPCSGSWLRHLRSRCVGS